MEILLILLSVLALIFIIWILAGYKVFYEFTNRNARKNESYAQEGTGTHREYVKSKHPETLYLKNKDNIKLVGVLLRAEKSCGCTVLLLHGYLGAGVEHMGMFAPFYLNRGFDVFIPDHRAHGKSGGKYIGFGKKDAEDCAEWCNYLTTLYSEEQKFFLHGVSMGAATACTAAALKELPKNVCGVISDCAFSSCEEQFTHSLKYVVSIPAKILLPSANIFCKLLAGYSLYQARAVDAVKNSSLPFLFIHGAEDTFVPTKMVHALYLACNHEKKKLWIVPNAKHFESYQVQTTDYEKHLCDFLESLAI